MEDERHLALPQPLAHRPALIPYEVDVQHGRRRSHFIQEPEGTVDGGGSAHTGSRALQCVHDVESDERLVFDNQNGEPCEPWHHDQDDPLRDEITLLGWR